MKVAARIKNRGLVFLRRSSGRQESSLQVQLEWAIREAARLEVVLEASLADLQYMQSHGRHSYKSIRLDDAVTGADLERAGFVAFRNDAIADKSISHVFLIRRDRLARPEDAQKMVMIEKEIRYTGVTFVMSDKIGKPLDLGSVDIGEEISMWIDYYESGEFLRKHAARVIDAKILLAKGGYWTGGRACRRTARARTGLPREDYAPGREQARRVVLDLRLEGPRMGRLADRPASQRVGNSKPGCGAHPHRSWRDALCQRQMEYAVGFGALSKSGDSRSSGIRAPFRRCPSTAR